MVKLVSKYLGGKNIERFRWKLGMLLDRFAKIVGHKFFCKIEKSY